MKTLEDLVTALHNLIREHKTLEAIEKFYDDDVIIQENNHPPRVGKKLNLENETNNLKRVKKFHGELSNVAINTATGVVFSEWRIRYTDLDNKVFLLEEISLQQWKNKKVVYERFYYSDIKSV